MSTLKNLKRLSVGVVGAAALAAIFAAILVARASTPPVNAQTANTQGPHSLLVDLGFTFVTPAGTINLDKGGRDYGEADLFKPGEAGTGTPIGELKFIGIATEPAGVRGLLFWGVFRIFDEGDFHVSVVADVIDGKRVGEGVITGGTGKFRGARGVYTDVIVDGVLRSTFSFVQSAFPGSGHPHS